MGCVAKDLRLFGIPGSGKIECAGRRKITKT